jgi:ATP-dependent exoDNAse (exonuclease V) alpha subunit
LDRTHAELAFAPALVLRPRGQSGLLRMYDSIAAELANPTQPVSVGLGNLVAPAAAARPAELLFSGLFPLPSNREQRRVLKNLRTNSAVVVQEPPGTGKTQTIANLICALLADGRYSSPARRIKPYTSCVVSCRPRSRNCACS